MSRRWRCQRLAISAPWASPAAASAAALQGHIAPASTLRSAGIRHRPDTRYGASGTLAMQPGAVELARGPAGVTSISPFGSMWQALGGYFQDPRLRQLFGRYATYCGSSPFLAPATLMLVAHVEQDGVWLLDGGMHTLAATLQRLAQARGARFRYGTPVHSIVTRDGRACGVRLAHGEQLDAAAVVFNGDAGVRRNSWTGFS